MTSPPLKPDASMKPDAELRVGDRVELIGEIIAFSSSQPAVQMRICPDLGNTLITIAAVRAGRLLPRPLAVGSLITHSQFGTGEIKGIDGGRAWVKWSQHYSTEHLGQLTEARA